MALKIGELYALITADDSKFQKTLTKAEAKLTGLAAKVSSVGKIAALGGIGIQIARSLAPATVALGHLAAAAAPAAGGILALPAAIAVAGAAVATMKVGLVGMGDALKAVASGDADKAAEALKKLPPAARQFVTVMAQTRNSFDPIRRAVQQHLFDGLAKQLHGLAFRELPVLRTGMTGVADSFNGLGHEALAAADTPLFRGMVAKVLATTAKVLRAFQPAVRPFISAMARLITIGLPLVQMLGQWAGKQATLAAQFLNSKRAADGMARTVARASAVFRDGSGAQTRMHDAGLQLRVLWVDLSTIGRNLESAVQSIAKAMAGSAPPATTLLQLVTDLTSRFAAWAQSAEGQKQLTGLFTSIQQVASNLLEILPQLGGVLSLILQLINSLPGPVRSVVLQMLAWSIVINRFAGPIGGAVKLFGVLGKATGITGRALGKGGIAAGKAGAAIGRAAGVIGAASGRALASLGRLAAQTAVTVARVVAGWVVMGVQALLQAARVALAWLIAMGPIAIVIAAVIGLVALIVTHWDTVKRITIEVFSAIWGFIQTVVGAIVGFIRDHWRLLITIIGGPLGLIIALVTKYWHQIWSFIQTAVRGVLTAVGWLAALPGRVAGWFGRVASAAIGKMDSLVRWLRGVPGTILHALGNTGRILYQAGKNVVQGLINGIWSVAHRLWDTMSNIVGGIRRMWPFSPAKDGPLKGSGSPLHAGRNIARMLAEGMTAGQGLVDAAAMSLAGATMTGTPTVGLSGAAGAAPGGQVVTVKFDFGTGNSEFKRLIQKTARVTTGGNVQAAFGR